MKQIVFILCTILYSEVTIAQILKDDLNFFEFNYSKEKIKQNKIKTITINQKVSNVNGGKSVYHFDTNGVLKKLLKTDSSRKKINEFLFLTNHKTDLICRIEIDYKRKKIDTVKYYKSYKENLLIKDSSSNMPMSYKYEYNSKGILIKTITEFNFGKGMNGKKVIMKKVDALNRIFKITEMVFQNENDEKGYIFSDRDIEYNKNGNMIAELEKVENNHTLLPNKGSITYSYDVHGNLIKILVKNGASYYYTFNEKHLITSERMKLFIEKDQFTDAAVDLQSIDKWSYTFYN